MNTIEKALQKQRESQRDRKTKTYGNVDRYSVHQGSGLTSSNMKEIDLARLEEMGMLVPANGRSVMAEEYRAIKSPILANAFGDKTRPDDHSNLVMVTSALPGEGKSFTSICLAMSIAMELDRTVLLVDADLSRSSVTKYLGIEADAGLVDYLLEPDKKLEEVLIKTNVSNLTILPSGRPHQHATELLASDAMTQLAQELANRYPDRIIVIDTPPLLVTSESKVLTGLVGQILIVVEAFKTAQSTLDDALGLLDGDMNVGLVLNKNRTGKSGGYYGGYGYGYYGNKGEN